MDLKRRIKRKTNKSGNFSNTINSKISRNNSKIIEEEKKSRAWTPSTGSKNHENSHGMVYSSSVKTHVGLKPELFPNQQSSHYEQQIRELMERVRILEDENKNLRQENKHIKQLYDGIYKDFHREKQRIIDSVTRNSKCK